MKKVIILIIVLFLTIVSTPTFAEGDDDTSVKELMDSVRSFTFERMNSLFDLYERSPDVFDDEYAEMTYKYFRLYLLLNEIVSIEDNNELKQNVFSGGKGVRKTLIFDELSIVPDKMFEEMYDKEWFAYRNQEKTLTEFMDMLLKLKKIQTDEE